MNVSNILSASRVILAIPAMYLILTGSYSFAVLVGIIAGLTDFLDGFIARKTDKVTELGKILDPLGDKVFLFLFALAMLIVGLMPLWFFAAFALRDILILAGGLYTKKRYNIVLASNFEGKVTFVLVLVTVLAVLLGIDVAARYGYPLSFAALLYSFTLYLHRWIRSMQSYSRQNS